MAIHDISDLMNDEGITLREFPFNTHLSFEPLLDFWTELKENGSSLQKIVGKVLFEQIDSAPELRGPLDDLSVVSKNQEMVDSMMEAIFPKGVADQEAAAIFVPFGEHSIFQTPSFVELMLRKMSNSGSSLSNGGDMGSVMRFKIVHACMKILREVYGFEDLHIEMPHCFEIPDDTGLPRFYRIVINDSLVRVSTNLGARKKITREEVDQRLRNIEDVDGWLELVNPEHYEFHGMVIFKLEDFTNEEALNRLQIKLLENKDILDEDGMDMLQDGVREYMRIPDLHVGLAAIDKTSERPITQDWRSRIAECGIDACKNSWGAAEARMKGNAHNYLVEDLEDLEEKTPMEAMLLGMGIRSLLCAPLISDDEMIGFLELSSPTESAIDSLKALKLGELTPLLSIALKRNLEAKEQQLQSTIRQQFTAIHPVVEWKFSQASKEYLQSRSEGESADMPEIAFHHVFPLYGQSDIQSSTEARNSAVQKDLSQQLKLAHDVLKAGLKKSPMPVLEEIGFRISKMRTRLKRRLQASDESQIQEFLSGELAKVFVHLEETMPELKGKIDSYRNVLDSETGFINTERNKYEYSLNTLNEHIAAQLELHQEEAQDVFPHYFERYKTDGVEYNMYIGDELVPDRRFDPLYLRNLRLWQLSSLSRIAMENAQLRKNLPVPLNTTQLILVHSNPLDIRFRMDEKRFDVDGAYNIRYEIIKKRIDKALDAETGERITQAGKIVIVFDSGREMNEYRRYIEFLQDQGLLEDEIEELVLQPMQGIQGMQALRVKVKMANEKDIDKAVEAVDVSELLGNPKK
jgi:GAF domain-containing protein